MQPILTAKSLSKRYGTGDATVYALNQIDLTVQAGEFVAVMGTSGSGKSTLLNMLSGLDTPTSGEVMIEGVPLKGASETELTRIRGERIGFVFQFFNLIPVLTAVENVCIPLLLTHNYNDAVRSKALKLLDTLGIGHLAETRPSSMSGGQQQRIAIARALINDPKMILADEPTGSLDSKTSKEILTILRKFCDERNHSMVMVTHDARVASYAHRILFMEDGKVRDEMDVNRFSSLSPQQLIWEITKRVEEAHESRRFDVVEEGER